MKKLGVVIPYYKSSVVREALFRELLNLLKLQLKDRIDIKVCITEDGSDSDWLFDFILKSPNFSYFRLAENKGISYARNQAIDYLLSIESCEYILFLDSDDYLEYDYFDKVMNEIKENPRKYYFTDFDILGKIALREGLKNHVTGIIFHKDLLEYARFNENLRFKEDVDFVNKYLREELTEPYYIDTVYYYNFGIDKKCLSYVGGDNM